MKGKIERIAMKNFMTFQDVEFVTDKPLNLIIGPNGSGKSSIVSAMVLGLGGKLKLADRGANLSSYVRLGTREAKIEIGLTNDANPAIVISRAFNTDNKCVWRIDGKIVSAKQIEELVTALNIQIGNLCQFLPQEKVTEFSKMNPQTLLENTEKSVGSEYRLLHMHSTLKDVTKRLKDIEKRISDINANLEAYQAANSRLAIPVNQFKERIKCTETIETLKKKRKWAIYRAHVQQTENKKKELLMTKKELEKIGKECEPYEALLAAAKKGLESAQKKLNVAKMKTREKINSLKNQHVSREPISEKIDYATEEFNKKIEAQKKREADLKSFQLQINKMQIDLQELNRQCDDLAHSDLIQIQEQISKCSDECNLYRHKLEDYKNKMSYLDHEIRAQESELQRLRNVAKQRLTVLQHRHPDVFKAVTWLRENKHIFSKNVYDPIVLEVNIKDPNYSKFFEAVVSNRDLLAFTFEDKDDMHKAMKIMRDQMHLKVNFLHSGDIHQPSSYFESHIRLDQLAQYGFMVYLADVIEAPEAVLKYLLRTYALHNIPIGSKKIDATFENVPPKIKLFFSEDRRYSISYSKYTKEKLIQTSQLSGAHYFTQSVGIKEIQAIEKRKEKILEEKEKMATDIRAVTQKLNSQESQLNVLVNKRKAKQELQQNRQALSAHIKMKQNSINSLERSMINPQNEEVNLKNKVKGFVLELVDKENFCCDTLNDFLVANKEVVLLQYEKEDAAATVEKFEHGAQEIKEKYVELESKCKELREEHAELATTQRQLQRDAEKAIADVKSKDLFKNVQETVNEIDKQLQTEKMKVDFIGEVDLGVLKEYEEREKLIEDEKQNLIDTTQKHQNIRAALLKCKDDWLKPLNELVGKINDNFSKAFEEMGCAGEVLLTTGEDQDDFEQYGLNIRVKYRDGEQLHELSQSMQSGGERSVATAIYMIALQELTFVPFRCVDEINQGMDPRNERIVFDLLVKAATRPDTPQYFLLTPKLLPDLDYNRKIKILCVFNGIMRIRGKVNRIKDSHYRSNRKIKRR